MKGGIGRTDSNDNRLFWRKHTFLRLVVIEYNRYNNIRSPNWVIFYLKCEVVVLYF